MRHGPQLQRLGFELSYLALVVFLMKYRRAGLVGDPQKIVGTQESVASLII